MVASTSSTTMNPDSIQEAEVLKETKQYTYKDGPNFVFMDLIVADFELDVLTVFLLLVELVTIDALGEHLTVPSLRPVPLIALGSQSWSRVGQHVRINFGQPRALLGKQVPSAGDKRTPPEKTSQPGVSKTPPPAAGTSQLPASNLPPPPPLPSTSFAPDDIHFMPTSTSGIPPAGSSRGGEMENPRTSSRQEGEGEH
ncbi:hypothetical protein KSP40_PGU006498 [Platanthera guangdongensis]|uniref:Uncharacterized protein n=1 Tax=Platanthera guangdongensis TaxID=2320717 RepID=A0ABR2MFU2_9ASPA